VREEAEAKRSEGKGLGLKKRPDFEKKDEKEVERKNSQNFSSSHLLPLGRADIGVRPQQDVLELRLLLVDVLDRLLLLRGSGSGLGGFAASIPGVFGAGRGGALLLRRGRGRVTRGGGGEGRGGRGGLGRSNGLGGGGAAGGTRGGGGLAALFFLGGVVEGERERGGRERVEVEFFFPPSSFSTSKRAVSPHRHALRRRASRCFYCPLSCSVRKKHLWLSPRTKMRSEKDGESAMAEGERNRSNWKTARVSTVGIGATEETNSLFSTSPTALSHLGLGDVLILAEVGVRHFLGEEDGEGEGRKGGEGKLKEKREEADVEEASKASSSSSSSKSVERVEAISSEKSLRESHTSSLLLFLSSELPRSLLSLLAPLPPFSATHDALLALCVLRDRKAERERREREQRKKEKPNQQKKTR